MHVTPGGWRPAVPRAVVVASLLALSAVAIPLQSSPVRAGGGLVTVMDALYTVLHEEARVQVTIDAVSTSHEADTAEGRVYYAGITLSVPPGSTNIAATSGGTALPVTVSEGSDATRADIGFSQQVFFGDSYAYRITFDMVDPGGASDRDFRIGHSVVAFPVWAFGSAGATGSSVTVILPAGFTPSIYGGPMGQAAQADGSTRLAADVTDPANWFAYVTAERPGIFSTTTFTVAVGDVGANVSIRAWDDDPQWAARTRSLLQDGLPALHDLIGLRWPVTGDLQVEESANRLGDYAGIYHPQTEKINVRYDADGTVTLHEAAHIWFNDSLFNDRWIGEAWAEFYGVQAAHTIGVSGDAFTLTDDLLASRIALNDWAGIGEETADVEAFAYAASYHVAQLISERTDLASLRTVWQAADEGQMSYQPFHEEGAPRTGTAVTQEGWQRLLDLLEERTGVGYSDLWSEWVVNPEQASLLVARTEARARYAEVVAEAGSWELPELIRLDLGSWAFPDAIAELNTAEQVLTVAEDVNALADDLQLTPPAVLRTAFEGNAGLPTALRLANSELAALEVTGNAMEAMADEPTFVEQVGLLLSDPDTDLEAARESWEAGDNEDAVDRANAVLATMAEADDHGRQRLVIGAGVIAVLGGGLVAWRRRGRGTGVDAEAATEGEPAAAPADPVPPDADEAP